MELMRRLRLHVRIAMLINLEILHSLFWAVVAILLPGLPWAEFVDSAFIYDSTGVMLWGVALAGAALISIAGMILRDQGKAGLGLMVLTALWIVATIIMIAETLVFMAFLTGIISLQIAACYLLVNHTENPWFDKKVKK